LTYTSLINALAVSSIPDKAAKAFNMMLEMETMANEGNKDVALTTITFGAVMKACARTSGNQEIRRKALRVALEAFDKLQRNPQLSSSDPMMYDSLFTTISNASKGQEYIKLVSEVFKLCCEDGALDDFILRNLRKGAPKGVFGMLVGRTGNVQASDLPREWSRNSNNKARR
jgi:pentatricopeptide repeat protein